MTRLRLTTPAAPTLDGAPWIFVGQDADIQLRLEKDRGPALRWGALFHEEASRLRVPFLDLVADLGRGQPDPAAWWAGALATKDWSSSELFLLSCYLAVVLRLAEADKPLGAEQLVVVVEDPWLLGQLAEALGDRAEVLSRPGFARGKMSAVLGGLARRARWALRMAASRLRLALYFAGTPSSPREGVLLYSYLIERSLEGDTGWRDDYLPGLAEELAAAGKTVTRCTYLDVTGFEPALARRSSRVIPMLRHASLGGFLRALAARPPCPPAGAELAGMPVGLLLQREWWRELGSASRCAYLLHLDASRRLLAAGRWTSVVMPWESQPQERLLALAAAERTIRSVGCQHSTVSPYQLPFFLGRGEAQRAPLPDLLLLPGTRARRLFEEGGVPAQRLVVAGNRRFAAVAASIQPRALDKRGDVLVILPIGRTHARRLLASLARRFPKGGDGFEFVIKPHPGEPGAADSSPLQGRVDARPLSEALSGCGCVVFCATSAGLEPWSLGHAVLRYRADTLLDIDPLDVLGDSELPTGGDSDLGERLAALRREAPAFPADRVRAALGELFAPVDRAKWLDAIC